MSRQVGDYFADEGAFRSLILEAQGRAQTDRAVEFVNELSIKAKEHGLKTFLSDKQLTWLCTIAGAPKPAPRQGRAP